MAITRSQIARQLLRDGGVSLTDAQIMAPDGEFLAYINPKEANMLKAAGGSGKMTPMGIPSFTEDEEDTGDVSNPGGGSDFGGGGDNDGFGGGDDVARSTYSQQYKDLNPMMQPGTTGETFPGLSKVTPRNVFGVSADNPMLQRSLFERMMIQSIPGVGSAINLGEMNAFNLPQFRYSNTGGGDKFKDDDEYTGDNQIVKPKMPIIPKLPTDIEPDKSDYDEFVQRFTLPERFRLAEGGEPRQAYGLGKLVKKVTGAVKKVAKSDLGKAALIAGTGYYLGGGNMGPFSKFLPTMKYGNAAGTGFGFGNILPNILSGVGASGLAEKAFTMGTPGKIATGIIGTSLAAGVLTPKEEEEVDSLSSRIADNTGIDVEQIRKEVQAAYASGDTKSLRTKYPFLITESAAAKAEGGRIGFENGGTYEDFEKFMMKRQESMSERQKEELRKQFENYMRSQDPTVEAAEGGSIVPEEDEMLDMGGNEMDLRGGGFVPLGEYEKKDDVPARLSKNEFVFTADAVRAAGGGSVDRGADLMYKTMKQLENKVV